ncbi:MAG TPA: DUF3656 domain-containing protein, partial [Chroococcidiopsis sp.]
GQVGQPLTAIARDGEGHTVQVESAMPLVAATHKPLTQERLREQLGRLGNTPFRLGALTVALSGDVLLPLSELNRLRRELVTQLEELRSRPQRWQLQAESRYADLLPALLSPEDANSERPTPELIVLVRTLEQLQVALEQGIQTLYCEFEDPRQYAEAVRQVRQARDTGTGAIASENDGGPARPTIWVAPPRITKPGETWILKQVRASEADGYLVRNYDHLAFFAGDRCIGDFSLNVANPLTADYFKQQFGLERLTASYDLNVQQLKDLLTTTPPDWFEVTIHQHMPMFHMEHCVFCAFLSAGTDYTNCGRPCETHQVTLRDRVGTEHVLKADAGCRNTVYNGTAQTGAEYVQHLLGWGVRHLRIEFVNETPAQVAQTIQRYRQLLDGKITGAQLWRDLQRYSQLNNQLGVTRGPMISQ